MPPKKYSVREQTKLYLELKQINLIDKIALNSKAATFCDAAVSRILRASVHWLTARRRGYKIN